MTKKVLCHKLTFWSGKRMSMSHTSPFISVGNYHRASNKNDIPICVYIVGILGTDREDCGKNGYVCGQLVQSHNENMKYVSLKQI